MGITNAQIAEMLAKMVASTSENTAAFIAAVEMLIQNDNRHHDEFRAAMTEQQRESTKAIQKISQVVALHEQRMAANDKRWEWAMKLVAGGIFIPALAGLVGYFFIS